MKENLVEIKQDLPGYSNFFGTWVCEDGNTLLVDVGPASTAHRLIESLEDMGTSKVDYILLTHIHIDHGGGLAPVLDHYTKARVICHEKALPYLVEPSTLWAGSLKVLGDIAEAYGEPGPVDPAQLIPHARADVKGLKVMETPGHAAHHLSFVYKNRLYAGEACGVYQVIKRKEYLRPATPPRFFLAPCLESIDRLLELPDLPIRFAHFGAAESSHRLLKVYRGQLLLWKDIIHREMDKGDADLKKRCMEILIQEDPNLEAFHHMDPRDQEREQFFLENAIDGFVGFLRSDNGTVS